MADLIISLRNAETIGADPRKLDRGTLEAAGHEKLPLLRVIRAFCIECSGGSKAEARKCTAVGCQLWPYRMGTNPFSDRKGNPDAFRRKASKP